MIPKRVNAAVPVVIGGLALGEALFYTAAVLVTGYTLYEAYDHFTSESYTAKLIGSTGKMAWNRLSTAAKAEWAALEATVVDGVDNLTLSAAQWIAATYAGLAAFSTDRAIIPAIPLPADNFNTNRSTNITVDHDFMVSYAVLNFVMNEQEFALMPWSISKHGAIEYAWYHLNAQGKWVSNTVPAAASAFLAPTFSIAATGHTDTYVSNIWWTGSVPTNIRWVAQGWDNTLKQILDSVPVIHGILQSVYGGLNVSVPAGWADVNGRVIPQDKDLTKPIPIPVPPGAISYPNAGEGQLTLNPDAISDAIGQMTGDITVPGEIDIPGAIEGIGDLIKTIIGTITSFFDFTKPVNWEPLKNIPAAFTTTFPFSLPWDLGRMIEALAAPPQEPKFTITIRANGQTYQEDIVMHEWLSYFAPIVRSGVYLLYTFGLVFATRKLFGGAK